MIKIKNTNPKSKKFFQLLWCPKRAKNRQKKPKNATFIIMDHSSYFWLKHLLIEIKNTNPKSKIFFRVFGFSKRAKNC